MSKRPFLPAAGLLLAILVAPAGARAAAQQSDPNEAASAQALLDRYCVTCHNARLRTADLALDGADLADVGAHADVWERVLRKLHGRVMPPIGRPRPGEDEYSSSRPGWRASSTARGRRRRIPAVRRPSTGSTGPSTATPSATCWRWI